MATDDRSDVPVDGAPHRSEGAPTRSEGAPTRSAGGAAALPTEALAAAAVDLTATLVSIDSVNSGLVEGSAGEAAIVDYLRNRMRRNGFEMHVITPPGEADRPSLVAIGPVGRPGPTVVLTGHVDTVGVDGMAQPFTPVVEGDRLRGRGSSDMKGGVAAMVVAAEQLVRQGMPGRVVLALVADEEDASTGAEAVLAALPGLGVRPDVVVVGEPTWLAVTESLRGYALLEVTLTGRAAHSSQPELGVNAVTHLGRLLVALERRDAELNASGACLMATVASGGDSPFVLARSAHVTVERRTVPGESSGAAVAEVEQLLTDLRAADPAVNGSVRLVLAREPWRLDTALTATAPDQPVPQRFQAPYWMEAPLWQAAGIPALVCGPAGGGLHAADEWVDLDQVRRYAVALTAAVARWAAEHAH